MHIESLLLPQTKLARHAAKQMRLSTQKQRQLPGTQRGQWQHAQHVRQQL